MDRRHTSCHNPAASQLAVGHQGPVFGILLNVTGNVGARRRNRQTLGAGIVEDEVSQDGGITFPAVLGIDLSVPQVKDVALPGVIDSTYHRVV